MKSTLSIGLLVGVCSVATIVNGQVANAQAPTAMHIVNDAAEGLGGKAHVLAAKALTVEGLGNNPNLGQQMSPEAPLLLWAVPEFKRTIDLERGRMRLTFLRRPAFAAVFDNQRTDQGLDGDIGFNFPAPGRGGAPAGAGPAAGGPVGRGPAAPAAPAVVAARRLDMLRHPLTAVRAALDPQATLANPRQQGSQEVVDITTVKGDKLTLAVDVVTKRPVSITTLGDNPMLGDVATVTSFSGYEYLGPSGLVLPKRIVETIDRWPQWDISITKNTIDGDVADLVAPDALRTAAASAANPNAAPAPLSSQEVAKGVWYVPGGISSVIVEFADHLAIIEVGQGDARVQALLAKAKELQPNKPVTEAIVTHFHHDHAGGLRGAIAAGLTIVTQKGNEAYFREIAQRKHTINPDALARNPKPLKIRTFDDTLTLKDAAMEVDLYHVIGSPHGDTLLMAYFPRERLLAQADLWLPGSAITPHALNFQENLERRHLEVDKHLPTHGTQVRTNEDFLKLLDDLKTGRVQ